MEEKIEAPEEEQAPDDGHSVGDEGPKKRRDKFRFGINYCKHPQLLPAFYGSVNNYLQKVMDKYLIGDGWLYDDLRKAARKFRMQDIFMCLGSRLGTNEEKAKHFEMTLHTILEAAKFQWLAPWKQTLTLSHRTCMKRQVGGLFLTYAILKHQPLSPSVNGRIGRHQKLMVDSEDVSAIQVFFRDVHNISDTGNGSALRKEIAQCYLKLYNDDYFEYSAFKDNYTSNPAMQLVKQIKEDDTYSYLGKLKDMRDYLLYMTFQGAGNFFFKTVMKQARLFGNTLKNRNLGKRKQDMKKNCKVGNEVSFPPKRKKTWTVEDVEELSKERDLAVIAFRLIEILKYLTPPNPMTLAKLTGADPAAKDTEEKLKQHVETVKNGERQYYDVRKKYRMEYRRKLSRVESSSKAISRSKDRFDSRPFKEFLERKYQKPKESQKVSDELKLKMEDLKNVELVSTCPKIIFRTKEGKIPHRLSNIPSKQETRRMLNLRGEEELLDCIQAIREKFKQRKNDNNNLEDDDEDVNKKKSACFSEEGETDSDSSGQVKDLEVDEAQAVRGHEEETDVVSESGSQSQPSTHLKWIGTSRTENWRRGANGNSDESNKVPKNETGESWRSSERNLSMRERLEGVSNWINMPDLFGGTCSGTVLQNVNVTEPDNEGGTERASSPFESLYCISSGTKATYPSQDSFEPLGDVEREKSPSLRTNNSTSSSKPKTLKEDQKPSKNPGASSSKSTSNKEPQLSSGASEYPNNSNGEPLVQGSKPRLCVFEQFLRSSIKFDEYLKRVAEREKAAKSGPKNAKATGSQSSSQ